MKNTQPMTNVFAAALLWMCMALAIAQAPADEVTVVRPDGQSRVFTSAALRALPREEVAASDHDKPVVFTGSDLRELLRAAEVEPPERVRGPLMRRVVLVQAADGYAVAFAYAELDLSLGDRRVYLVDRVGDMPLAADDGPWRLVVPRDARGGRWVKRVTRISVIDVP